MSNRLVILIGAALIAVTLLTSALAYPGLPNQVASHWNAAGNADGYLPAAVAAFLLPVVTIVLLGLMLWLPRIDPLRANIDRFRPQYNFVVLVFCGFLLYLHLWTLAWNLGRRIPIGTALTPAAGAMFFLVGASLKSAKPNWIFGIRTPWTLSSPAVWERTHIVGSVVFKIFGVLAALGAFFPEFAVAWLLILISLAAAGLILYSYILFSKWNSME